MRLLIDSMILVMVLVLLFGTVAYRHAAESQDEQVNAVRKGVLELQTQLEFQSALWMAQEEAVGYYPPQIMPDWFGEDLPRNSLIAGKRPWLDIAPAGDYNEHPPDPLATGDQAAFWYNPELGIIRARVTQQVTDRQTLERYNYVNGTSLTLLYNDSDPERAPIAFNPNPVTSGQHASPDRRTIGMVEVEALEPEPADDDESEQAAVETEEPAPWWEKSDSEPEPEPEPVVEQQPNRPSLLAP